ncbi:MAG: hypothetical protein ABSG52_09895 [Terriglobales bacterium]|jgi:hypothetical protein
MPQTSEYRLIMGNGQQVNKQLNELLHTANWKPILMSSCIGSDKLSQVQITVIVEHVLGT